jgi:hypothetical protein
VALALTESISKKKRLSEGTREPKRKKSKIEVLTSSQIPGWKPIAAMEDGRIVAVSESEPQVTSHASKREGLEGWMSSLSVGQVVSTDTKRALGKSKPSGITQAEQLLGESLPHLPSSTNLLPSSSSGAGTVNEHIETETDHQGASSTKKSATRLWVHQLLGHWGHALVRRVSHPLAGASDVF